MLNLVSNVTTVVENKALPIGGQIWKYDNKIETKKFKYVANIVGKGLFLYEFDPVIDYQ